MPNTWFLSIKTTVHMAYKYCITQSTYLMWSLHKSPLIPPYFLYLHPWPPESIFIVCLPWHHLELSSRLCLSSQLLPSMHSFMQSTRINQAATARRILCYSSKIEARNIKDDEIASLFLMSVLFTNVNVWFDYLFFCNTLHLSVLKQQVIIKYFAILITKNSEKP